MKCIVRHILTGALALTLLPAVWAQSAWVKQDPGSSDILLNSVDFVDELNGVIAGADGFIVRTSDGGATWLPATGGGGTKLSRVRFISSSIGFIVGEGGTLLKTVDGGATWLPVATGTTQALFDCWFWDEQTGIIAGQGGIILATSDGGQNWASRNSSFDGNNVYALHFPSDSIGWAVGNKGKIARSTDKGRTWREQNSGFSGSLTSVSFGSRRVGTAVGEAGTILHTTNAGQTWVKQQASVPLTFYLLYGVQHVDTNRAFIVGFNGIILSTTDGGQLWDASMTPDEQTMTALDFITADIGVIVGMNGQVYRTTTGGRVLSATPASARPATPDITSVYPHPALSMGLVSVSVTAAAGVALRVDVVDALGRTVAVLHDGSAASGRLTLPWSPRDTAPGLYVVRAISAGRNTMRPVVLR